ncbi:MAG: alpha/beta fold hydrolase [Dehalococcoidia bacterium]
MTTITIAERYVTLSHGKTRYLEAGSGDPVILLHGAGFTSGAENWLLTIDPLATRFRVLAIDCLGWGLGDRLNTEYSFAYLVDHVRELQDALGIERAHLVGHSMGGWIGSLLAYESPNRVDKLVLVASGGTATRPLATMVHFKPPAREEIHAELERRFGDRDVDIKRLEEQEVRKTQNAEWVEAFGKVMAHMTNPTTRARYNTLRRLPHITAPTLIIWGSDDQVNALAMGEETHRLIPNSRLVVLDGCGHGVPTERPEEFSRLLLDFL